MNNNNAIEIEGELDEDDFQENQLSEEKKSYEFHQSIKENEIIDSSNLMNLEQMLKGIQNCYEKELKSALSSCENLSLFHFS